MNQCHAHTGPRQKREDPTIHIPTETRAHNKPSQSPSYAATNPAPRKMDPERDKTRQIPGPEISPRQRKCSKWKKNLLGRKECRTNDGKSRQNNLGQPAEIIDSPPTTNWTPPPLRPHAVPLMTASPTVIPTEARGTDAQRQLGDEIKLPHIVSALPSPLHPTDLTPHPAIRQQAVNSYRKLYSRFRPQPPIWRAST